MIKIENTEVFGWEAAIRGMRNPMNSWDKSDSGLFLQSVYDVELGYEPEYEYVIGENDLKLMQNLSKAGNDHGKFLRMINVTMDVTAPLYWWKEFDTYKVGTVANSCSTMHKIHAKEFTLDDFSWEHLRGTYLDSLKFTIGVLNKARNSFLQTSDKLFWWQMIQLLPNSYNQRRTVQLNYAVLRNINRPNSRKFHKQDEWREFCKWCDTLPYYLDIFNGVSSNE